MFIYPWIEPQQTLVYWQETERKSIAFVIQGLSQVLVLGVVHCSGVPVWGSNSYSPKKVSWFSAFWTLNINIIYITRQIDNEFDVISLPILGR